MIKRALKKGKNNILHTHLGQINETHGKKIILIVDNIDDDPTKICFCESYFSAKILRNPYSKPMSEVIIKMGMVYIDLWGLSPNNSLEGNCYI